MPTTQFGLSDAWMLGTLLGMRKNHRLITCLILSLVVVGLDVPSWSTAFGAPTREPIVEGQQPPALTPFAKDDPIPKLSLHPTDRGGSPIEIAETFLAHLTVGYHPIAERHAGGTIMGGDTKGFEKAWAMMGENRPSLEQFQASWSGTLRMGVIQLEPITPNLFFVELERIEWCGDHWAISYYFGELQVSKTSSGWQVLRFELCPERLDVPNIIGHTSWHHSDVALASVAAGLKYDEYDVISRQYQRRTVNISLRNKKTGEVKDLRMARVVEGSWMVLEPRGWPTCGKVPG